MYTSRKQIYYWSLRLLFPCITFNKAIWLTQCTQRNWNHILCRFSTDEEGAKDNKRQPKTETCLSENVPKRKRRNRSHFTQRQLQYLEKIFSRQQYLTRDERTLLARGLEMTELQIRNWFQNQRYQKKHRANENKKQEKLEFSVNGEKVQPWTIIQESVGHSKWRIPACNLHGELSFAFCKEASVELVKQRTAQTEAKDQQ